MKYYCVEPDVPGELGPKTVFDRTVDPPIVTKLHYIFEGWFGDELLTSDPVFLFSKDLSKKVKDWGLTGVTFKSCKIEVSDVFTELQPDVQLPEFVWGVIVGEEKQKSDFFISKRELIVSDRAWSLLKDYAKRAEVSVYRSK